jgi:release factor glutamine methyltransferase
MASPAAAGTVEAVLQAARALGIARIDAQRLLAHQLQRPRTWLLAHADAALAPAQAAAVQHALQQLAAGWPLPYLLGEHEFHGLQLQVTPAVLIPRADTETLVDWALQLLADDFAALPAPEVMDLGTGSGAIALAVKHRCPRARVRASDRSEAALEVARSNALRLGLDVDFSLGDWWRAAAPPPLQLALSNPPYIAAGDPHLPALRHEPGGALVPPDGDGLSAIQWLIDGALAHLVPGGWLLLEHGHDQSAAVAQRLQTAGFTAVAHRHDLAGHVRCTGGRRPAQAA